MRQDEWFKFLAAGGMPCQSNLNREMYSLRCTMDLIRYRLDSK